MRRSISWLLVLPFVLMGAVAAHSADLKGWGSTSPSWDIVLVPMWRLDMRPSEEA